MPKEKELDFIDMMMKKEEDMRKRAKKIYCEARSETEVSWVRMASEDADVGLCALVYRIANEEDVDSFVLFMTQGELPQCQLSETERFLLEDTNTFNHILLKMRDIKSIFKF